MSAERKRSWMNIWLALRSPALWAAMVIGTLAAATLLWFAGTDFVDKTMKENIQKAAITVFTGGVLGGLLKFLLDVVSIEREQRNDTLEFLRNSLNELKSVFDLVDTSRAIMMAHDSFEVYEKEILQINKALVKLRNVKRAFLYSANDTDKCYRKEMVDRLKLIGIFLNGVVGEFSKSYSDAVQSSADNDDITKTDAVSVGSRRSFKQYISDNSAKWENTAALLDMNETEGQYKAYFTNHVDQASALFRSGIQNAMTGRSLKHSLSDKTND